MVHVLLQGWLNKRGEVRQSWKKRFFSLHSSGILEYSTKEECGTPATKGTVQLCTAISAQALTHGDQRANCIEIITPERIWLLEASDPAKADLWLAEIDKFVRSAAKAVETVKEGFVIKQGSARKSWRKRFVVLCRRPQPILVYFKDKADAMKFKRCAAHSNQQFQRFLGNAAGFFELGCDGRTKVAREHELDGHKNVFVLQAPDRVFYASVEDEYEQEAWLRALWDVCQSDSDEPAFRNRTSSMTRLAQQKPFHQQKTDS